MKIEHIAIWTVNIELVKQFYEKFFAVKSNNRYVNTQKEFTSYFLSFPGGARIELMHRPDIAILSKPNNEQPGLAHLAISVGSKEKVNQLTEEIRSAGHRIIGEPRTTGDGYYESVVADPEGNRIELTV